MINNDLVNLFDNYNNYELQIFESVTQCNFFKDPLNELNIIHVNIRSINKNYDNFLAYIASLQTEFDIMLLSETLAVYNLNDFQINNYDIYYNNSRNNKNDGMVIYVRSNLNSVAEIMEMNNYKFLRITLNKNNVSCGILGIYRLPSMDADAFVADLSTALSRITPQTVEVFGGDINIDIIKNEPTVSRYLNSLCEFGYNPYINKPTRENQMSSSCIDHLFVKKPLIK